MAAAISVLVTSVGGRAVGHQIMQALAMAGDRYRIVATDAASFAYGLYQADCRYKLPLATSPDYLDAVQRLVKSENIQAILPGTQPETAVLSENSSRFHCPIIANPPAVVTLCKNKQVMQEWLEKNNVAVPRCATGADWRTLARECGFPLVAKPTEDSGGSRGVAIIADASEAESYLKIVKPAEVIFQEYVGDIDSEYTVGVMVSKSGQIIDSIVMHRHLVGLSLGVKREIDGKSYGLSTGYSQGFMIKHPQIQQACEALAIQIGARGPLNVQLRVAGGKVVVFEVHPRFSGTASIRAMVGFNEPDMLIRNFVFGETFGRLSYQTDVAAIRALSNIIVPRSQMRDLPEA